jgi:hypothetical protein
MSSISIKWNSFLLNTNGVVQELHEIFDNTLPSNT